MSNDQPTRRPPAKSSGGGAPIGSTISIVIAIVAVVVGFIILQNINDTGEAGDNGSLPEVTTPTSEDSDSPTSTSGASTTQTTTPNLTSTTLPLNTTAKIVVANASGIGGAAGAATTELQTLGFNTGTPTDAFGAQKVIPKTIVYYKAGGEATAQSVAQLFSTTEAPVSTAAIPAPIPVKNADIGDATVLVMVGTDLANKPLPAIAAPAAGSTATTLAGATVITGVTTTTIG